MGMPSSGVSFGLGGSVWQKTGKKGRREKSVTATILSTQMPQNGEIVAQEGARTAIKNATPLRFRQWGSGEEVERAPVGGRAGKAEKISKTVSGRRACTAEVVHRVR